MQVETNAGPLALHLPAGEYRVSGRADDAEAFSTTLTVSAGDETANLGDIAFSPRKILLLIGKQAPEIRGIENWVYSEPLTLESLNGQVVLLEFWGLWCPPCVASMPHLMEVNEKYAPHGLKIVTVHAGRGNEKDTPSYEEAAAPVSARLWDDRKLPFPIALTKLGSRSAEGEETPVTDYGISAFPTTIVIGKDGKIIDVMHPMDEKLPKVLEKALGMEQPATTKIGAKSLE